MENAPSNASAIGADAFALFTRNQRRWESPPLTAAMVDAFRAKCGELGFSPAHILPHDSYLINLAHPERSGLEKSREAFIDEMGRCRDLGLVMLNFHPGSTRGELTEKEGLTRVAESLNLALDAIAGITAVIENTAGMGHALGHRFEHLAEIISRVEDPSRVGVCLDTCHLFAAGYDLRDEEAYRATMEQFASIVGMAYLRGMHLNDSRTPLGSRVDRHHSLGEGHLGWEPFRFIMQDPRTVGIPLILETTDPSLWSEEIRMLRQFSTGNV